MDRRYVLFDFDGVIADSFALAYDVSRRFTPELDEKGYRKLFEGNVYESLKKLGPHASDNGEQFFAEMMPRFMAETTLTKGMPEAIASLHESYTLAIISSTITASIEQFLAHYDLSHYFAAVMGKDVHTSKVEKMRMLFQQFGTNADACVFVTDTLGDIREAETHGMGAIGVSWGFHDRGTLEQGVPFRIVEAPVELPDAVHEYFAS